MDGFSVKTTGLLTDTFFCTWWTALSCHMWTLDLSVTLFKKLKIWKSHGEISNCTEGGWGFFNGIISACLQFFLPMSPNIVLEKHYIFRKSPSFCDTFPLHARFLCEEIGLEQLFFANLEEILTHSIARNIFTELRKHKPKVFPAIANWKNITPPMDKDPKQQRPGRTLSECPNPNSFRLFDHSSRSAEKDSCRLGKPSLGHRISTTIGAILKLLLSSSRSFGHLLIVCRVHRGILPISYGDIIQENPN